jgi:hypothetical protein
MNIKKLSAIGFLFLTVGCTTEAPSDLDPGAALVINIVDSQGKAQKSDTLYWFFFPDGLDLDTTTERHAVRRVEDGSRWAIYDSLHAPGLVAIEAYYSHPATEADSVPEGCSIVFHGRRFIHSDTLTREIKVVLEPGLACS